MTKFKETFIRVGTSQQRKQFIHLLIFNITMNKEREIDSIEIQIQINNDVITYLKTDVFQLNKVTHPFCIYMGEII